MYSALCDITWDRVSSIAPLCDKTRVSVSLLCLTLHRIVPVYACGLVLLCMGLGQCIPSFVSYNHGIGSVYISFLSHYHHGTHTHTH